MPQYLDLKKKQIILKSV